LYNRLTSWGLFYYGTVPAAFRAGDRFAFWQLLLLTLTLCFARVRCAGFDVLSLSLNKERTKENQRRRSPWEPPGIAALQSEKQEVTQSLLMRCLNLSQHERQARKAKDVAFRFAKNLYYHKVR
jgi:hypothetical protein